jgi:hypothetical protein
LARVADLARDCLDQRRQVPSRSGGGLPLALHSTPGPGARTCGSGQRLWRANCGLDRYSGRKIEQAISLEVAAGPATMNGEGLADAGAASPFRLPRFHPGSGLSVRWRRAGPRRRAPARPSGRRSHEPRAGARQARRTAHQDRCAHARPDAHGPCRRHAARFRDNPLAPA